MSALLVVGAFAVVAWAAFRVGLRAGLVRGAREARRWGYMDERAAERRRAQGIVGR